MSELQKLFDDRQLALSSLAADTALTSITKLDGNKQQGFRILKLRGWADLIGKTEGDGPIIFGFAAGDIGVTKIKEALDADPSGGVTDPPSYEAIMQSKYPIWILGVFPRTNAEAVKQIHYDRKIKWSVGEGRGFDFFVYNSGGSALTPGATLENFAEILGVWLND